MSVDDYIAELEAGCKRLAAPGVVAVVRANPPSIGSFLYATSPLGAVEISIDSDEWFVEFWRADSEYASSESTLASFSDALDAARLGSSPIDTFLAILPHNMVFTLGLRPFYTPQVDWLNAANACTMVSNLAIPRQIVFDPGGPCEFLLM